MGEHTRTWKSHEVKNGVGGSVRVHVYASTGISARRQLFINGGYHLFEV